MAKAKSTTKFQSMQALRTNREITSEEGLTIPAAARFRVVSVETIKDTQYVTGRVQDSDYPELLGARIVITPSRIETLTAGRPKGAQSKLGAAVLAARQAMAEAAAAEAGEAEA